MPLVSLREIENDCLLGTWHITESLEHPEFLFLQRDHYLQTINAPDRKMASVAARMLLKQMLSHWKMPYRGLIKNENGVPQLEGNDCKISISHSGSYAMALLHKNKKNGIDVELVRDKILKIAHRVFSENEIEMAGGNIEKLTVLWCAKEAIYKMHANKKLSFRDNMLISPFEMEKSKGNTMAKLMVGDIINEYKINYEKFGDYLMAYTY